jgi:hypothetical protein
MEDILDIKEEQEAVGHLEEEGMIRPARLAWAHRTEAPQSSSGI